jgi:hypothetical protein
VVDRPLTQIVAGGEARMAGPDDDGGYAFDGEPSDDRDGDLRGVRQGVEHRGALLGLSDQRLDLLL